MAKTVVKANHWTAIMYPDAMKSNWLEILESYGMPASVSPLHDKDTYADDTESHKKGDQKKAHYHLIMCWSGPKTQAQVHAMLNELTVKSDAPIPFPVAHGVPAAEDYQTHEGKQEKVHYEKEDIRHLNGFDTKDYKDLRKEDTVDLLGKLMDYIIQQDLYEYWDLIQSLRLANDDGSLKEVLQYVQKNSYLVGQLLRSRREKRQLELDAIHYVKNSDYEETGEVTAINGRVFRGRNT